MRRSPRPEREPGSASFESSSQDGEDMSTLTSLPREVLKWLLSLNLSFTVRNLKRDFSNGFLFAEILSRYYPNDVTLHSFENVISMERKRANWVVLAKLFKRRQIPIDQQQVDAIIAAEGNAAGEALMTLHAFINSAAYQTSLAAPSTALLKTSPRHHHTHHTHHTHHMRDAEGDTSHSRSTSRGRTRAADADPVAGYYNAASTEEQQWYAQQLMWQQMYQQQHHQVGHSPQMLEGAAVHPYYQQMQAYAAMQQHQQHQHQHQPWGYEGGNGDDEAAVGDRQHITFDISDELAYGKAPRPMGYKPYSLKDFTERNYDAKKAPGYWTLGRLGADKETQELQAKRERNARIKELGRRIQEANTSRLTIGRGGTTATTTSSSSRAKGAKEGGSCRERATQYASSIPRPEVKKTTSRKSLAVQGEAGSSSTPGAGSSGAAAGSSSGSGGSQGRLQQLVEQHQEDAARVDAIMAELQGLMLDVKV